MSTMFIQSNVASQDRCRNGQGRDMLSVVLVVEPLLGEKRKSRSYQLMSVIRVTVKEKFENREATRRFATSSLSIRMVTVE